MALISSPVPSALFPYTLISVDQKSRVCREQVCWQHKQEYSLALGRRGGGGVNIHSNNGINKWDKICHSLAERLFLVKRRSESLWTTSRIELCVWVGQCRVAGSQLLHGRGRCLCVCLFPLEVQFHGRHFSRCHRCVQMCEVWLWQVIVP